MKKKTNLLFAVLFVIASKIVTPPVGLSSDGVQVLAIFIATLFLWIKEGIDWPSVFCLLALMLVPSLSVNDVLRNSFGNQTFVFLLFTFICTDVVSKTPFMRRIALGFVRLPFSRQSIWHLSASFLLGVLLLGLVMSPTVLFFVVYPILQEIFEVLELEKGDRIAEIMLIALIMVVTLSSGMTPIAHIFPVLAMASYSMLMGVSISYASYMVFGIVLGFFLFGIALILLWFLYRHQTVDIGSKLEKINTVDVEYKDWIVLYVFIGVIFLWIAPDVLKPLLPRFAYYIGSLTTVFPPMLGVLVYAVVRIDDKPILRINDAMTQGVSWPSLLMSACALAIAGAMTHESIGLIASITNIATPLIKPLSSYVLIAIFVFWASFQSNLSSHMVTAQLVSSVAIPIAYNKGNIHVAGLTVLIGFLASLGWATPPSMPYVAISGASGWTKANRIMKYGFIMMGIVIIVAILIGYPLASLLLN